MFLASSRYALQLTKYRFVVTAIPLIDDICTVSCSDASMDKALDDSRERKQVS